MLVLSLCHSVLPKDAPPSVAQKNVFPVDSEEDDQNKREAGDNLAVKMGSRAHLIKRESQDGLIETDGRNGLLPKNMIQNGIDKEEDDQTSQREGVGDLVKTDTSQMLGRCQSLSVS